jgi:hypothetical protein
MPPLIRPSTILVPAGNGIFADRCYQPTQPICFYDGKPVQPGSVITEPEPDYIIGAAHSDYPSLVGNRTPTSSEGVAQLINDGASPQFDLHLEGFGDLELTEQVRHVARVMSTYLKDSLSRCNVAPCAPPPSSIITHWYGASKPIATGAELFLSYGSHYWLSWHLRRLPAENTHPWTKALRAAQAMYSSVYDDILLAYQESGLGPDVAVPVVQMLSWSRIGSLLRSITLDDHDQVVWSVDDDAAEPMEC